MLKKTRKKRIHWIGVGVLAAAAIVIAVILIRNKVIADREAAVASAILDQEQKQEAYLISQGYVPLVETMKASGYSQGKDTGTGYFFYKRHANMEIDVTFDLEKEICRKNEYDFDLADSCMELRDVWYIKEDALDAITNRSAKEMDYKNHPWTEERLIAHAGGGVRDANGGYISSYTNSYEALVQNYNLGCRVFEFDFALTNDGRLAAVHDWKNHGNMNGEPVSSKQWDKLGAVAKPLTPGTYTSIYVEDILDQMLVNEDMYVVTDVKFDDLSEEEIRSQFEKICGAARSRDASILNRIIPQVYSPEMYDWIMEIYPFQSVIFTCYKTEMSAQEIIDFCAGKENIHVITTQYQAVAIEDKLALTTAVDDTDTIDESVFRFTSADIDAIHAKGMLIYNFTVSSYTKMYDCLSRGIDGIYSNNILPQDMAVFDEVKSSQR